MIFKYGKKSKELLNEVDHKLSYIFKKVLDIGLTDISILTGLRSESEQNDLYYQGLSKLRWPKSKHNCQNGKLSMAIDAAPYVNGNVSYNHKHCCFLAGIILAVGKQYGYNIRWGGNWDMDGEIVTDQTFQDLLHYELIDE